MIIKVIYIDCNHWFLNYRFDLDDIHEEFNKSSGGNGDQNILKYQHVLSR